MKIVTGPGQYIRDFGLVHHIAQWVKPLGNRACLIGGRTALAKVGEAIGESFNLHGMELVGPLWYGGECSLRNIEVLKLQVQSSGAEVLIAAGGGKAIDTVKALGFALNLPVVAVPTIAATCAATTAISILYDDHGSFLEICRKSKRPELVLVDTCIILQAPERFLAAGIGDTLAKWFEAKASTSKIAPNALNRSALALAKELYQLLLDVGSQAIETAKTRKLSPEFEDVVDAILLVSGSVSGYGGDDCRTAAAHAIYSGLTLFPQVHQSYHGEIVAFGILAQLAIEGRSDEEITHLISFYEKVRLPYTLQALGLDPAQISSVEWEKLGETAAQIEDMLNMPFKVTPQMVLDGIRRADALGRSFTEDKEKKL